MKISGDMLASLSASGATARALPDSQAAAANDDTAFRDFEALLLGEVLKRSQRPTFGTENPLNGGSAGQLYRELLMDEIAGEMADAGALGIAKDLAKSARDRADAADTEALPNDERTGRKDRG